MNILWWVLENWFTTGLIIVLVGLITGYGPMRDMLLDTVTCFTIGVTWWLTLLGGVLILILWLLWPINLYLIMKEWMK